MFGLQKDIVLSGLLSDISVNQTPDWSESLRRSIKSLSLSQQWGTVIVMKVAMLSHLETVIQWTQRAPRVCSPLQHVPDYTRYRPVPHHWTPGLKLSQRTTGSYHTAGRRNSTGPDCYTAGSWTPPSAANAWTNTGDRGWIYTRYEAEIIIVLSHVFTVTKDSNHCFRAANNH